MPSASRPSIGFMRRRSVCPLEELRISRTWSALMPLLPEPSGDLRSTPTVAPEDAAGTVRYREVHGLPPLTEESE